MNPCSPRRLPPLDTPPRSCWSTLVCASTRGRPDKYRDRARTTVSAAVFRRRPLRARHPWAAYPTPAGSRPADRSKPPAHRANAELLSGGAVRAIHHARRNYRVNRCSFTRFSADSRREREVMAASGSSLRIRSTFSGSPSRKRWGYGAETCSRESRRRRTGRATEPVSDRSPPPPLGFRAAIANCRGLSPG